MSDGSWTTAASDVKATAALIPKMFGSTGDCTNMVKDVEAIAAWADRSYWKLAEQVAKDMLFHRTEIENDAKLIGTDWQAGKYYDSGMALAALLTVSLGPIESDSSIANLNLKPEEEFISGLLWGFIGDNHLDEI